MYALARSPAPEKDEDRSFQDWIDQHVARDGFFLDQLDFRDENASKRVDFGEILTRVEKRLRTNGESESFHPRTDLVIVCRACRILRCDISELKITPHIVMYGARFGENTDFGRTHFSDNADFSKTHFGENAYFRGAQFGDGANFYDVRFAKKACLSQTQFGKNVNFESAEFRENADFSYARFGKNANFERAQFWEYVNFYQAEFNDPANFHLAGFGRHARFSSALFGHNTSFSDARFGENANFRYAQFGDDARFLDAKFGENADFRYAQFGDGADFVGAQFGENANFRNARFSRGVQLTGVLLGVADLRDVEGLVLDETVVRDASFSTRAPDPWSVLRRTYTGPSMIFTLLFLTLFFTPYALRTAGWVGVHNSQERLVAVIGELQRQGAGDTPPISEQFLQDLRSVEAVLDVDDDERWRKTRVWRLVLGVDKGWAYWLTASLLILYNLNRALLTFLVAPMRDEEERSGHSPKYRIDSWRKSSENDLIVGTLPAWFRRVPGVERSRAWTIKRFERQLKFMRWVRSWTERYAWLVPLHRVAQVIFLFVIASFLWNAYTWLRYEIYMPVTP